MLGYDKMPSKGDYESDAARKRANDTISPLTPTMPNYPFESENEGAGDEATAPAGTNTDEEDMKPANANDGIELGVEVSA